MKDIPTTGRRLVKVPEACRILAISPRLLFSYTQERQIPVVRMGVAVRYDTDDLWKWVEDHKTISDGVATLAPGGGEGAAGK